jgi:hypothetical protein
MKISPALRSVLAGISVFSLLIYVLACATSFSPDDRQVLYPSFDPHSGATAVAVYDRRTGQSELLYTAAMPEAATNRQPVLMRAGWLPDGKHILVGSITRDDQLEFLVIPRGVHEAVRHFPMGKVHEAAACLEFPFAIADNKLFLNDEKHEPARMDLVTGEIDGGNEATNGIHVLPTADAKIFAAFTDTEYGVFDPQTMQFKSCGFAATNVADGTLPTFDPAGGRLIEVVKLDDLPHLQIRKSGQIEWTRPLARGDDKLEFGPFLDLAPGGKTVVTAYCAVSQSTTNAEYGLLEIPLSQAPLRFTPLFHTLKTDNSELLLAQPSLSHDGKTWAMGTGCLYLQNDTLKAEDCALFLVNLTKANRPVTKVSIPVPADRKKLIH